jgi:AcrR family transcriptional regulator
MSPRKPAVLRDGDGQDLRDYLITTAARLIGERGSAGLSVRDIAREAQVSDGVLYNYFEDKEDLLAQALLVHVGTVMVSLPQLPPAGTGTLAENLRLFIDIGIGSLTRVVPAFAGLLSQPKVLVRFHAMVGGDAAFAGEAAAGGGVTAGGDATTGGEAAAGGGEAQCAAGQNRTPEPAGPDTPGSAGPDGPHPGPESPGGPQAAGEGPAGLPAILTAYLGAEQRLGRVDEAADIDATVTLVVGAIHGQVLPRVLFSPPGSPITVPPDLAGRLAETVLSGIAPGSPRR